jgi:hypothetical protein
MNENEKLSVAELKQRLLKLKPREALWVELRDRGLSQDRCDDAIRLIAAEFSSEKGGWATPGDSRPRSVSEVVDEFQVEREYMFRDVPVTTAQREAFNPATHYADGTPLPPDQIDFFALAGKAPKPEPGKPSEPQPGESRIDADFRLAGPTPKPDDDDAEGLKRWNDELDRQTEYRESAHKERDDALRAGGMKIESWSKAGEE